MKKIFSLLILILSVTFHTSGQTISFTYDADGNMESRYTVTLRSSENTEDRDEIEDRIKINSPTRDISIYPNPTQGRIRLNITQIDTEVENYFRLYDMNGQLLLSRKLTSLDTEIEIAGAPGIYLLNIHLGEEVSKWKIIKQ